MLQVHSLAFGTFAQAEPLNPQFTKGHSKLRITVDTGSNPGLPDQSVLHRLEETFPGLGRHQCRASEDLDDPTNTIGVFLIEGQSSANQAHMLEHLLLEILMAFDAEGKLSGVTCAYRSPPERNDVFVECGNARAGGLAAGLAVETLNVALGGGPLAPFFPDAVLCLRALLRRTGRGGCATTWLSALAGIPAGRAVAALEILSRIGLVETEPYAMNLSGEAFYRLADVNALDGSVSRPPAASAGPASAGAGRSYGPVTRTRSSRRSSGRSSTPRGAP